MLQTLKRKFYFFGARYFRFWAAIKLKRWAPRVVVVTGSAGKTTLLHLIESQLGTEAHYSHHANSAYGIPFDILGLRGVSSSRFDWLGLIIMAPVRSFAKHYREKIYIAEVDTDRPGEAAFLAHLLKPDATLWVSSLHTHTAQFDSLIKNGKYGSVEDAIAADYGNLLEATSGLVVINGDSELMKNQLQRTRALSSSVSINALKNYQSAAAGTLFEFGTKSYRIPALLPKATFYQLAMVVELLKYLQKPVDNNFTNFVMPPGRSNVFNGIIQTTLIDSTYNNSNIDSLREVVEMFEQYSAKTKWAVIGDLLEQGVDEAREHNKIAEVLNSKHFERLILVGPRVTKHTAPNLSEELKKRTNVAVFTKPTEVLEYINQQLEGQETILFKGVRFLEGVIEQLLENKQDANKLPRREAVWRKRRKEWGL